MSEYNQPYHTKQITSNDTIVRQPMCNGGKIQLPSIYKSKSESGEYENIRMNDQILESDLCYNRCPNGEAPRPDPENGIYYCAVPALVTYNVNMGVSNETTGIIGPDTLKNDSYSVSCQSTDITGGPVLSLSGIYEDPTPPNTIRSINYTVSGTPKWFCKRPMYGSPNISHVQSEYESLTKNITQQQPILPNVCKSIIFSSSSSSQGIPNFSISGATGTQLTEKEQEMCFPSNLTSVSNAALSISNGIPIQSAVTNSNLMGGGLAIAQSASAPVQIVPGSAVAVDKNTGTVVVSNSNQLPANDPIPLMSWNTAARIMQTSITKNEMPNGMTVTQKTKNEVPARVGESPGTSWQSSQANDTMILPNQRYLTPEETVVLANRLAEMPKN